MLDRTRQVGPLERLHCLKTFSSFRGLPQADLVLLAQYASERFFRTRANLLGQGLATRVHVIVEGRVRLRHRGRDLGTAGPGEALGFLELLAQHDDGIEAIAETEVLTLTFHSETLRDILEDHFSILNHLLSGLCALRIDQMAKRGAAASGSRPYRAWTSTHELDLVERIMFFRRALPFARGSIAALAELSRFATDVRLKAGSQVWKCGDDADDCLFIVSGSIGTNEDGGRLRFGAHATPGMHEAFAHRKRWYTAVAEVETQALRLDASALLDMFEDNFEMAMEYLATTARECLSWMQEETRDSGLPREPDETLAIRA